MLVLQKMTLTQEESTDSGNEEQTQEWTEPEANGESVDTRTGIQDQIQESDNVEKEESSPSEVQSDQSQNGIHTSQTEQLSDLPNGSLEEAILTQEPDKTSTSVSATEMSQNNDIQGLDLSEHVNKQSQDKYIEHLVSSEQKSEPENELPEEAQESELREPDESESSEQIQRSDEQTPQSETEPPECPDASSDLADEAQHAQDVTSVHRVTEEVPVPDTNATAPCINGSAVGVNRAEAQRLAERLYRLDGFQRTDVVRHLDKE